MNRQGKNIIIAAVSIRLYGCKLGRLVLSTAVEPSQINTTDIRKDHQRTVGNLYAARRTLSMKYFQYGQVLFRRADGKNLVTPMATEDQVTEAKEVIFLRTWIQF